MYINERNLARYLAAQKTCGLEIQLSVDAYETDFGPWPSDNRISPDSIAVIRMADRVLDPAGGVLKCRYIGGGVQVSSVNLTKMTWPEGKIISDAGSEDPTVIAKVNYISAIRV